jgi:hypothetical protein
MINNPLRIFPYSNWVKKRHSICCPTLTLSHQKSTHMYLLQFSTDYAFPLLITSYIIGIVVLYLVVRIAVSDGTKDLRRLLFLQNNLKIRELQKKGLGEEAIHQAFQDATDMRVALPDSKAATVEN